MTALPLRVAIGILLTCVLLAVPQPTYAQQDRSGELQGLVDVLGKQLSRVRQVDRRESDRRVQQLSEALDRWNHSARTNDDYRDMETWLRGAIRASLAGQARPMPELPEFVSRTAAPEQLPTPQVTEPVDAPLEATDPAPAEEPAAVAEPQPLAESAQPESQQSVWQQHPAAQPLDLGDPFADDPQLADSSPTPRVVLRPAPDRRAPAVSTVSVNSAELNARVRGYTRGLRGIEAQLLAGPNLKLEQLVGLVRELQNLSEQRDFVSLYLDTLDDAEMSSSELPKLADAKRMIRERLDNEADTAENANTVEALRNALRRLSE